MPVLRLGEQRFAAPPRRTTFRVRLGDDETALLGRLAEAHPSYLMREDCDPTALSNLVAIKCAWIGGKRVWVGVPGFALRATRTPRKDA